MFHLFVSANEESWMGEPLIMDAARCLKSGEYTEQSLAVDFTTLTPADHARLAKFPCIFAYAAFYKAELAIDYEKHPAISRAWKRSFWFEMHSSTQRQSIPTGCPTPLPAKIRPASFSAARTK